MPALRKPDPANPRSEFDSCSSGRDRATDSRSYTALPLLRCGRDDRGFGMFRNLKSWNEFLICGQELGRERRNIAWRQSPLDKRQIVGLTHFHAALGHQLVGMSQRIDWRAAQ